ncbi:DUF6461 domain-containing protein [Microbispora sp. NBC_01189]|uniref:DUF6461 domain-containing protein n=1 Tax=Microbispora sp. NBC_01189 TaxID=2903583 RepID=UPI002E119E3F|nr:DUF6461 domain-containing protein [Microbispora sp. NBC_01189]
MSKIFSAYDGIIRQVFDEPVCVTWFQGAKTEDIVRRFGGDPEKFSEATFVDVHAASQERDPEGTYDTVILVAQKGEWTVVVEPASFRGADSALMRDLSRSGRALALYWTVNHDAGMRFAANGSVVSSFDPLEGPDPQALEWLRRVTVTAEEWREDWMAAAFAVGEELCGIRIDQDWLQQPHWAVTVSALPIRSVRSELILREDMWALVNREPRLAALVTEPTADKYGEISLIMAEMAVRTAGVEGHLIDEALRLIVSNDRGAEAQRLRAELDTLATSFWKQASAAMQAGEAALAPSHASASGRLMIKHYAVQALGGALDSDPYQAVMEAIKKGGMTQLGDENEDFLRMETLNAIRYFINHGENAL